MFDNILWEMSRRTGQIFKDLISKRFEGESHLNNYYRVWSHALTVKFKSKTKENRYIMW